jgi:acetone carboxylase gamma subunit
METGFILDLGHGNMRLVPTWVQGEPERSIWMGLKLGDRRNLEVRTYRCPECGLLESYALKTSC